ncbi:MAG: ECF transporter S component [Candidatus Omnitrophica bacterium]|nr:ECF transporter S component [Candidatus Omnitrophota bacterium]
MISWHLIACTILFLVLFGGFYVYERCRINSRQIAIIVSLAVVAGLARVPFAGLPSVQPTTSIILISGYVFGPFMGYVIGLAAAWISNLFLVQGPWTLWQMIAWGLAGFSGGIARQWFGISSKKFLLLLGLLWGFLFGWIMNLWYWLAFSYPLNWKTWLAVNAASFWFDLTHAISNVVFIALLGGSLLGILGRFKAKIQEESKAPRRA